MIRRDWRILPADWSILSAIVLGISAVAIMGLVVGGASITGAIVVIALIAMPAMIVIEGAPLWVFLGLFPLVWQTDVGGLNGLNILSLVCISTWAIGVLARRQASPLPLTMIDAGVIAFFLVCLLSILTRTTERVDWHLQIYMLNFGLYFVARSIARNMSSLRLALWAFVGGTAAAGLNSIIDYASGVFVKSQGLERLGQEGIGINNYAAVLLAGTAVALGLALGEWKPARRLLLWGAVALLMIAVVLSKSRGALVGQVTLIGAGIFLVRRGSHRVILALPGIVLGLLLLPGIAQRTGLQDYAQRMHEMVVGGGATESPRVYLWQMGLQAYRDHPLTGVGVGNFPRQDIWFPLATRVDVPPWVIGPADVHSFFLGALAEVGVIGAAPLFMSMVLIGLGIYNVLRNMTTPATAGPIYGVTFGLVAYFTAVALLPAQTMPLPYILLGLGAALPRAAEAWSERPDDQREEMPQPEQVPALSSLTPALQFQNGAGTRDGSGTTP